MMLPLIVLLTMLAGFTTYVFIRAPGRYYLKLVLIPASLVVWVLGMWLFMFSLGHAYPHRLPDDFTYIAHQVVVHGKKVGIEVWVKTTGTRLFLIPYSKRMEEVLDGARQAGKGGGRVELHKLRHSSNARDGTGAREAEDDDAFDSNLKLPADDNPKDEPAEETQSAQKIPLDRTI
ncbi:MAG TPA: hypothetical protein VMQ50_04290 [Casimicrobiaceae bacterium]|nr:hypothetical protein [Casimicrobiaceae bacterium]